MSTSLRTIIMSTIALVIFGGLGYEIFLVKNAEADIKQALTAADTKIGTDSRTRGILSIQNNSKEDLQVIDKAIITKSELVNVIDNLEKTGRGLGLTIAISSITSDASKNTTTPQNVRISVEATGKWFDNMTFLKLLENLPYKISIERADMGSAGEVWHTSSVLRLTTLPDI